MSKKFLPTREAELLAWSRNLRDCINESSSHCGLSADEANQYHATHEAFAELLEKAQDFTQRTPVIVQQKNDAKQSLIALARQIARRLQAMPETTDALRERLGLTVRAKKKKRIARPSEPPEVQVVSVDGFRVRLRLCQAGSQRRALPDGVKGATVFSYVGDQPPSDREQWTFERQTSSVTCEFEVSCSNRDVANVWLTAQWFNPRGEAGPAAKPVRMVLARAMALAA